MRARWTDLAVEAQENWTQMERVGKGIERTVVRIESDEDAQRIGRPKGVYVTLSCPQTLTIELEARKALSSELAEAISQMLPPHTRTVLVAGLGNRNVTPDALGPRTVDRVLVTRHMAGCLPEDVEERIGSVCTASPGVLGVTGIETAEVLRGMVEHVKPDAVIAVDALAARSSSRICSTIQVADTGISPGSGVGNHQKALCTQSLGAPVLAVGVPMVVYASTIVGDALSAFSQDAAEKEAASCIKQVVSEQLGEMIVTPREVDALVERMAGILAEGINMALHPGLEAAEIAQLMAQ